MAKRGEGVVGSVIRTGWPLVPIDAFFVKRNPMFILLVECLIELIYRFTIPVSLFSSINMSGFKLSVSVGESLVITSTL